MKLGLPHRVHARALARGHRGVGRRQRLRGARARRVAGARRPPVHRQPPRRRALRRAPRRSGCAQLLDEQRARRSRRSPTTPTTCTPTRQSATRSHDHLRACIDAAALLGGVPVGTFIGRDPGRSVAENLREAEAIFPRARRLRGRARRQADDRELRDGGLASGRLPRQPRVLARAVGVDVRARAVPQLRPLAPAVARHRPGRGAAAVRRPGRRTRTRRTPRCFPSSATATASSAAASTREQDPWDMGWWRYRDPRPRRGRLAAATSTRSTRAASTASLSVEHEDPVWGGSPDEGRAGPGDRAPQPRAAAGGAAMSAARDPRTRDATDVLEVRGLVKEYPGVQGARRRRLRRARRRGPLPARAQRRRQVDADQVRLGRGRADRGRDPRRRRAAAGRATPAGRSRAASRRSTRSSTSSRT